MTRPENEAALLEVVKAARALLRRLDEGAYSGNERRDLREALSQLDAMDP
jgi:hypothetical protein